jgi:hypothetical protein
VPIESVNTYKLAPSDGVADGDVDTKGMYLVGFRYSPGEALSPSYMLDGSVPSFRMSQLVFVLDVSKNRVAQGRAWSYSCRVIVPLVVRHDEEPTWTR